MSGGAWLWELARSWRLDGLGALFAALIALVGAAAAVYSPAYLAQERYRREPGRRYALLFALFLGGMLGVAAAADLVVFLVCWEVMTLASYALVAHDSADAEASRAAFKYFVMTHAGTACLLLAVVVLGARGGFPFDELPGTLHEMAAREPVTLHVVLGLLFVGFATKAGLWPFGDWLPDAHPAAPAPVSALLSGVMVKLGLYGFLRVFVWVLPAADPGAAAAWGMALLAAGTLSAVIGGAAAAAALDAKVLLAYSSIAQSGLVAAGTGAALVLARAHPALAALALLGAVFHVAGDAFVKSLLFLNAGALQYRTGSRRLEDMGGLLRAMPVTGWTALAGCLAIAGFPPLTAFVSKWLLLQSTVLSATPFVAVAGLAVLVASLLSVLYAVKLFGAAFLCREMREGNLEVPAPMRAAQLALAAGVLALGLAPGAWLRLFAGALGGAPVLAAASPAAVWSAAGVLFTSGAYAPALLLACGGWVALLALLALGDGAARRGPAWLGGLPGAPLRPHPSGLFSVLRGDLGRAYPRLRFAAVPLPPWLPGALDPGRWLYRPLLAAGRGASRLLSRAHTGLPHAYIAWQLLGAVALVLLLVLRRRFLAP